MSDIIIRNPGNLYWLIEQSTWDRKDTPASYEAELSADMAKLDTLETKLNAIELLGEADVHITLAVTLQGGVNDDQLGPLVQFAVQRPWITGINFQALRRALLGRLGADKIEKLFLLQL